jgi:predicted site-specific integrase-resolvase
MQEQQENRQKKALTVRETARRLGRSRMTIMRYLWNGQLKGIQSTGQKGGRWMVLAEDLERKYGPVLEDVNGKL